ncbi:MAG: RNA methyltransferase [Pseudomonadota bacterium]
MAEPDPARARRRPAARRASAADARGRRPGGDAETIWLFGLHAVRDALCNPARRNARLLLTRNARQRLETELEADLAERFGLEPEMQDPRRFSAPLDPASVHQGAALETRPLDWGALDKICAPRNAEDLPRVALLDRVTDPHNVGAVLRSAEVFGARAVVGLRRHGAPETGALAKAASGALERQPYLRVTNLGEAITTLQGLGYAVIGLDERGALDIQDATAAAADAPLALVFGAEGAGLREKTRGLCDALARIESAGPFASLNVSNAAAVALFAARARRPAS